MLWQALMAARDLGRHDEVAGLHATENTDATANKRGATWRKNTFMTFNEAG